jgi:hypothetical protein
VDRCGTFVMSALLVGLRGVNPKPRVGGPPVRASSSFDTFVGLTTPYSSSLWSKPRF